ncbi:MAG: carboxy terminal-processing peptidase [Bdellovibrionota bacterium]
MMLKMIKRSLFVAAFSGASLIATPAFANYQLSCKTVPELFKAYLTQHIVHKSLTPELQARTMDQFIKQLDPTKMLLLQSDVVAIKKDVQKLFLGLRNGDCQALDRIQDVIQKRVEENAATAKKLLGDDKFKIDETIELVLNPDKREFPKNEAEKAELLRRSIHFQVWNYLGADTTLKEAREKLIHRYDLNVKRVKERKDEDKLVSFIDAFTGALDPHTNYFSKERDEDFKIDMTLSLDGIGASLSSSDGYTVVEEIIPGGAADRAKVLIPKDKIIAVAQDPKSPPTQLMDMDLKDVVRLIRGKRGTTVKLTILRKEGDGMKRFEVSIVRDKIDLKEQAARIDYFDRTTKGGRKLKLAVLDLPSFYGAPEPGGRSAYNDVKKLLEEANEKKVDGLVLNLARNGGGLLEDAVRISGLFIKEGAIVATLNSRKDINILRDRDPLTQFAKPLVVLTSRASASASEILAGAMNDYNRALIVGGDNTFGKGSVQAVLDLPPDLGSMKVTTGMFFVPGGQSTQFIGVKGHVVLPSTLSTDDLGEKHLDNALPPLKINPFKSKDINDVGANAWTAITPKVAASLAKLSKSRVSSNEKFKEIEKDIKEMNKNDGGTVKLAELMKKEKADKADKKKKEEEDKSFRQRIEDMQRPYVDESLNVLADLVEIQNPSAGAVSVGNAKSISSAPTN